jgi:putative ATP-binding cassette transporter
MKKASVADFAGFTKWVLIRNVMLGILSGLCSFLFIHYVNRIIALVSTGTLAGNSTYYALAFAAVILLFMVTRRSLSLSVIKLSQSLFWSLRKQMLALLLQGKYRQMMDKKADINTAILSDVSSMTQASCVIIDFFVSAVLSVSCLIYLAFLSWILFSITLVTVLIGVAIYGFASKTITRNFQQAIEHENRFIENFNAILGGFKEIYLEPRKGKFIYEHNIIPIAKESYGMNRKAYEGMLNSQLIGQFLFYTLISSVLLFFSLKLALKPEVVITFIFTLMYLLASVTAIMGLLPVLIKARVAYGHMMALKQDLETAIEEKQIPDTYFVFDEFNHIKITDLHFSYEHPDQPFNIGPINIEIEKGEVVFIYGGNGSGKTTFINCMLGLYIPSSGEITLNNACINPENYPYYKTVFSAIFSDFYLFNEIIGIDHFDEEKWHFYLKVFELDAKVSLKGKHFSTTNLSTGQRKRLALIIALLEKKPVLVLDEWAADQDPYFRKKFYTIIIPLLKQEGFTIIAITHDDKYYHCANKLFRMDEGRLFQEDIHPELSVVEKIYGVSN